MNTQQLSIILNEVEQLGGVQAKRNFVQIERLRCCYDELKEQLELCCKELARAERMCEERKQRLTGPRRKLKRSMIR